MMNELIKTALFGSVAAIAVLCAFATNPSTDSIVVESGDFSLTPKFEDPNNASNLKIIKYDEELAKLTQFEVSKDSFQRWSLPSHDGYPADAADQIRDATIGFLDFKSLAIASDEQKDHSLYGVVEPSEEQTSAGDEGIGMLVEVKNESGMNQTVVEIIIGKKVKNSRRPAFCSRKVGQDRVYVAEDRP